MKIFVVFSCSTGVVITMFNGQQVFFGKVGIGMSMHWYFQKAAPMRPREQNWDLAWKLIVQEDNFVHMNLILAFDDEPGSVFNAPYLYGELPVSYSLIECMVLLLSVFCVI